MAKATLSRVFSNWVFSYEMTFLESREKNSANNRRAWQDEEIVLNSFFFKGDET